MIEKVSIRNFRSIVQLDLECGWITTLVGRNDAGKSNILRALNLFFNGNTDHAKPFQFSRDFNVHRLKDVLRSRQAPEIDISLTLALPRNYWRQGHPNDKVVWRKVWREHGLHQDKVSIQYYDGQELPQRSRIPVLLQRYIYEYVPAVKDPTYIASLQGKLYTLLSSGAADVLRKSASRFEQSVQRELSPLVNSVRDVFGTDSVMRLPEDLSQVFEELDFNTDSIPLDRRGDGIKIRHVPILLKFMAERREAMRPARSVAHTELWGFEEPENNIELAASFEMVNQLVSAVAGDIQVLMTTHSPVFYGIKDPWGDGENVRRAYVNMPNNSTSVASVDKSELDEHMGLMALVEPHIEQAKDEYDELRKRIEEEKSLDNPGIPVVFVEGPSDSLVLQKATSLFADSNARIRFEHGAAGDDGGCRAVIDRAYAWQLTQLHSGKRAHAIALLDDDESGRGAKAELKKRLAIHRKPTVQAILIFGALPDSHQQLIDLGYRLPVDLESLYSDEFWKLAQAKGWLGDPPQIWERYPKAESNKLGLKGGDPPYTALAQPLRYRVLHQFSKKGKMKAAEYLANKPEEEVRPFLAGFKPLIREMLKHLI